MAGTRAGRAVRVTTRLCGITPRYQGTHDSLCAYYAAVMMLCAMRPELEDHFDTPQDGQDPLLSHVAAGSRRHRVLAQWLVEGIGMARVRSALDRACRVRRLGTRFNLVEVPRTAVTLGRVRALVEGGLPCVLAWDSAEMGHHSVLVVGHEVHGGSPRAWLRVLDPARVQTMLEWGQLVRAAQGPLELLHVQDHDGVRPDRVVTRRDRNGRILGGAGMVERWDPALQRWTRVAGPSR